MIEAKFTVVGHCADGDARLLSVFEDVADGQEHILLYRVTKDGVPGALHSPAVQTARIVGCRYAMVTLNHVGADATVEYLAVSVSSGSPLDANVLWNSSNYPHRVFRTLSSKRPPRVALVTCNGPWEMPQKRKYALWRELQKQVNAGKVDLVLHGGDQIYADPVRVSALELLAKDSATSAETIYQHAIARYVEKYLWAWSVPEMREILGTVPHLMMWDDHEVYDGWGSNEEDAQPESQAIFRAAKEAFSVFQRSHGPMAWSNKTHGWGVLTDSVGIAALDGRSLRNYSKGVVHGAEQLNLFAEWLKAAATLKLKHLFVMVGIPVVFAPIVGLLKLYEATPWREEMTDDLRDAWVAPNNAEELRRLLFRVFDFIKASPETHVTLLSGDVHVGTLAAIHSTLTAHGGSASTPVVLHQITSSGIATAPPTGISAALLRAVTGGAVELVGSSVTGQLLRLSGAKNAHLVSERNFVIISMSDESGNDWDAFGNQWVEFCAEDGDAVRWFEQVLLRG